MFYIYGKASALLLTSCHTLRFKSPVALHLGTPHILSSTHTHTQRHMSINLYIKGLCCWLSKLLLNRCGRICSSCRPSAQSSGQSLNSACPDILAGVGSPECQAHTCTHTHPSLSYLLQGRDQTECLSVGAPATDEGFKT